MNDVFISKHAMFTAVDERRRRAALENIQALKSQKVNVKKALQQELDDIQAGRLHGFKLAEELISKTIELDTRGAPTMLYLTSANIFVGTKDGTVLRFDYELA